jgi:hypothetical protein
VRRQGKGRLRGRAGRRLVEEALLDDLFVLDRIETDLVYHDALAGCLGRHVQLETNGKLIPIEEGSFDRSAMNLVVFCPPTTLLFDGSLPSQTDIRPSIAS